MNLRRVRLVLGLLFVAGIFTGCDPSTAIYKIFSDQGLTLIKPARSYIQIGGLVILPKGTKQLLYQDPWDTIDQGGGGSNATPPSTDFSAVIMSQSDKSASGVDFKAVLAQLVSLPLGFDLSHNKSLTLGQVQASGTRYTTPMMAALVAKPNTAQALRDRLSEGSRVFVIQEVYTSTGLSVTSGDNTSISASLGSGGSIPSCALPDSGSGGNGTTGKAGATATGATTGKTETTGTTGISGTPASKATSGMTGNTGTTGAKGAASETTAKTGSSGATIAGVGAISAGVCFANSATLSFTSTTPVPFAARLNEITLLGGTTPAIKYTGYKLPNGALPASDPEVENSIAINQLADSTTLTPLPH